MGRHAAPVPLPRRIAGAALGLVVIIALTVLLWTVTFGISGEAVPETTVPSVTPATASSVPTSISTTTTAPTTTSTAPTTSPPTTPPVPLPSTSIASSVTGPTTTTLNLEIELRPDGLGAVELGDAYEEVRPVVDLALGPADSDTGWIGAESDFGTCPGNAVRVIRWASLRLFFSDGPTEFGQDVAHFFYYNQSSADTEEILDLVTPAGVGLGTTVAQLEDAYGEEVTIETTLEFGPRFVVDPLGPAILSGTLTGTGPDGVVTSIGGGFGCGG